MQNRTIQTLLYSLVICCLYNNARAQPISSWTNTGPIQFPINVSGQVHGMGRVCQQKFHPSNPAKQYAVSASGGLYISNDTGHTWAPTPGTEVMPNTACASVCIDYTNDNILYLGTGDPNYYSTGLGVWKSTDGGATFSAITTGIGYRMAVELIMSPTNHNTIIAATNDGIWRTTDAGATWTQQLVGGRFTDMKQRPGSNNVLYAVSDTAYYRSLDMGVSWTRITSGLVIPAGNGGMRIAVSRADTNRVYIGTTDDYGRIMRSTNGGLSFTNVYYSTDQCLVCYDSTVTSGSQGNYNFTLTANPDNANELLLGSHCVWRSTDGGASWSWRTQWWNQVHTDMHDINYNPYNTGVIYNANDGGIWRSTDPSATNWIPFSTGLAATEIYHAAQSPISRELISIGTQDNGELYYDGIWKTNRGGDWGERCAISRANDGTVYYNNGQRRNLTPLTGDYSYNAPFTAGGSYQWTMSFSYTNVNNAFVATDSIWRTNNLSLNSLSWTFLYSNGEGIYDIACSRADSNLLFAITNNGHLLRSTNALSGAPTFTQLSTPVATNILGSVALHPYNKNIVYITCNSRIYKSTDMGNTWINITGGLPSLNILKVHTDQYNSNERLFVSLGNYMFYKDNTTPWTVSSGLPTIMNFTDFMMFSDSTSGSVLRLSSYGRGVWESNMNTTMPPDIHFTADKQTICPGDTVHFSKSIFGNVSGFTWYFPGGTPATSTADSPIIVYNTIGSYNVMLSASGSTGSSTDTATNYILVSNGLTATVNEGFEGGVFLPSTQWQLTSESGSNWQPYAGGGAFGLSGTCVMYDNFNHDAGGKKDRLILPKLDLTTATYAYLTFDVAYAYYPDYKDSLLVEVSTDCGKTYSTVYSKDSADLATAPNTTSEFVPATTEWRKDSISLNSFIGNGVVVAFTNKGHYGQKIYLDNINLKSDGIPAGISNNHINTSIKLNPNPNNGIFNISGKLNGSAATVTITDMSGRLVYSSDIEPNSTHSFNQSINLTQLQQGIYIISVRNEFGIVYTDKVVIR